MKKKKNIIGAVILIVMVVVVSTITLVVNRRDEEIKIEYNNTFPNLNLKATDNSKLNMDKIFSQLINEKAIIIYISDQCEFCLNILDTISLLSCVEEKEFDIILLWDDNIPESILETKKLNKESSYSLRGKYSIESTKPYIYLVDKKTKKVTLKSGDVGSIINYLTDNIDENNIKKAAIDRFDSELLVFKTSACEACNDVEDMIKNYDSDIKYSIVCDYLDFNEQFYDATNLLRNTYGIKQYPAFVDLNTGIVVYEINELH